MTAAPTPLEEELRRIGDQFRLADVYVFGSRADEITHRVRFGGTPSLDPAADVDIGVRALAGVRLSASDRVELTLAFETAFDAARVDLVVVPEASPFLALSVIRGELLFCANPDDQAEYELYVLRVAGDLEHIERERREIILDGGR